MATSCWHYATSGSDSPVFVELKQTACNSCGLLNTFMCIPIVSYFNMYTMPVNIIGGSQSILEGEGSREKEGLVQLDHKEKMSYTEQAAKRQHCQRLTRYTTLYNFFPIACALLCMSLTIRSMCALSICMHSKKMLMMVQ